MQPGFFSPDELRCRCGRPNCDAAAMRDYHLRAINDLRRAWGKPLAVDSGARCEFWNKKKGGELHSRHMICDATDFAMDPQDRFAFVALAIAHGFTGIGVGKTFVHVDSRPLSPGEPRHFWTYPV
jgi:zinc D-Ala-D-Ala carboxypeptidase